MKKRDKLFRQLMLTFHLYSNDLSVSEAIGVLEEVKTELLLAGLNTEEATFTPTKP